MNGDEAGHNEADVTLPAIQQARILVVDDNPVNRQLLLALLDRGGFSQTATAVDGEDGLRQVNAFNPDLILLDLMMPNVDGFEMCRRLRADPRHRDLPVLVQSSLNRAEDRGRAFSAGATDYVSKPINAVELVSRVRIHVQKRMLVQSLQLYRQRAAFELELARKMQARLMPQPALLGQVEASMGVTIEARFTPSSELGGDCWDMRPLEPGRLAVWLVDFSGHGVGAALNTFRLHAVIRQLDFSAFDPGGFLGEINRRLCGLLPHGQYATLLVGVLDLNAGTFTYASAASTRPLVWSPSDPVISGDNRGLPAGLLASAVYENRVLAFPAAGSLFLYSDAAIELPVGDDVLDDTGLAELVMICAHEQQQEMAEAGPGRGGKADDTGRRPPGFLDRLLGRLEALAAFDDDLTALVISRRVPA